MYGKKLETKAILHDVGLKTTAPLLMIEEIMEDACLQFTLGI